jgi:hypothetical protein
LKPSHPKSASAGGLRRRGVAIGGLSLLLAWAGSPPAAAEAPAAVEASGRFDAEAYYPLAPGNVWVWQGPGGPQDVRTRTIVGRVDGPKGIRAEVQSTDASGAPTHRDQLELRDGTIYRLASLFADGRKVSFEPPLVYAPFSSVVGEERTVETREVDGSGAAKKYQRLVRIHESGEIATLLATFRETLALTIADYPDPKFPVPERVVTIWFARGFGPVRLQVESLIGKVVEDVVYARIGERAWGTDPRGTTVPRP